MNILTDELPVTIEIDGREHGIDSDFRTCLQIILAFEDAELTPQEKQIVLLSLLYDSPPSNTEYALLKAHEFLNGGEEIKDDENGVVNSVRVYSFEKDANFIFAAFKQTHGIDLSEVSLHWWKFLALFMDLGSETTFCQLTSLRKRLKTGKATKEERVAARELGSIFDLPEIDTRTLEEKEQEAEFMRLVNLGKQ